MPTELNDTTSPSEEPNWYDWRVSNWGTKWEVSSEGLELSEDGTEITGWFDSAWAPPIGAFEHYCRENEDVDLVCYYEEPGMDFAGKWDNGADDYIEGVQELVENYIRTGEYPEDELFRDIDEYFDLVEQRREWIEESIENERLAEQETVGNA